MRWRAEPNDGSGPNGRGATAEPAGWGLAAVVLLAVACVLVLVSFRDYAVSNDEWVQHTYGEKLLSFYSSGLADRAAFAYRDLFYYGGLFDMIAVWLAPRLPLEVHDTRHLLSAGFGIAGLAGCYALGRLLFGARAGVLGMLALALTGPWWGGMFNHTKDVPFATAMLWALWALCALIVTLPKPPWPRVLAFGLFVGLGLGLRVGAVLNGLYLAAALAAWLAVASDASAPGGRGRALGGVLLRLLPAGIVAYGLMALLWPWAVLDPLNPVRALAWFSALDLGIDTIIGGRVYGIDAVPRAYLPVYLAIKLPPIVLVGLTVAAVCGVRWIGSGGAGTPRRRAIAIGTVVLAALFPVGYFVLARPPAYDGIRHFLFVVPPLAVLAGAGLDRLLAASRRLARPAAALAMGGVVALALLQAGRLVLLHPHQVVDYNPLVGGPRGAEDRYVMDYWANSVPEATRALASWVRSAHGDAPPVFDVWVCSDRWTFEAVAPPFLRWTRDPFSADFLIAPTHMNCDAPADWPPAVRHAPVILEVRRLGALLAVVRDRRARP